MEIKSLPKLEAERLAREPIGRGDTGQLTKEELTLDRQEITTRSSFFVMEGVKESSINLAITSENAKIAFFSPTDGALEVQLTDPSGRDLPVIPHTRTRSKESEAFTNLVIGRGNPEEGVMLITDRKQLVPGIYTATLRQSKSPIDIFVNDEGGPELNLSIAESNLDSSLPVVLQARLVDGQDTITGARLTVKIKGTDEKRIKFEESAPGIYTASIKPSKMIGMNTLVVEAKGTTRGLDFMRNGSIDVMTGKANANIIEIGKEEMTDTDLVVQVKIDVTASGRYYVRGNLLSSGDEPIAWAQDARELSPGQHTLTLKFARELIIQSGQAANFKLSDVTLMNTTEMPGVKAPKKIVDYFLKSSL